MRWSSFLSLDTAAELYDLTFGFSRSIASF